MTFTSLNVSELPEDNETENDFKISLISDESQFSFLATTKETKRLGEALIQATEGDFSFDGDRVAEMPDE